MIDEIQSQFFAPDILEFNNKRIINIENLLLPISGKTILEPGCGPGLISKYFYNNNCKVFPLEGRKEIVSFVKENNPSSNIITFDLENDNWDNLPTCDISIAYGILYHLSDPLKFIDNLFKKTNEFCVIETVVSLDTAEDNNNVVIENNCINQALNKLGCRPTRKHIWNYLISKFTYVYMPLKQTEHSQFPKQFKISEDYIARCIFIGSKVKLDIPTLSSSFITEYYTS
jgi:hypothetical protein